MNFLNFSQDFFRLRQFYFIAKAGSLSNAAQILNISHSALSISMKRLEDRLDKKLFKREAGGLKLTSDGERLIDYASKMFEDGEVFLKEFRDNDDDLQGTIRIITTAAVGETILTHNLLPFLEKYPNLNIDILPAIDDFDLQDADIAIRPYLSHRSDVNQLPLFTFHLKLWASKEYLDRYGVPQTVNDLDNHRLLAFKPYKSNFYFDSKHEINWILHVGNKSEQPRRAFYQIRSHEGIHHAASKGYGIAQLPREYVKTKNSSLIEVLPQLEKPKIETYFIFRKLASKSKRIEALYSYLKQSFDKDMMPEVRLAAS